MVRKGPAKGVRDIAAARASSLRLHRVSGCECIRVSAGFRRSSVGTRSQPGGSSACSTYARSTSSSTSWACWRIANSEPMRLPLTSSSNRCRLPRRLAPVVGAAWTCATGGSASPSRYESQFATNHLGHFQLTLGLLPALQAAHGARIVNVTSGGHRLSDIRWDDPHFTDDYDPLQAYGRSKTANVLFAVELERRWAQYGIHAFAAHPGIVITTNLGPHLAEGETRVPWLSDADLHAMGLADAQGNPVIDAARERKTAAQGASTAVFGAMSPLLEGHGLGRTPLVLERGPRQALSRTSTTAIVASR